MSTLQSTARLSPPGDEDLQHLYDEVWRIFDEETSVVEPSPVAPAAPAASLNLRETPSNTQHTDADTLGPMSTSKLAPVPPRPPRMSSIVPSELFSLI